MVKIDVSYEGSLHCRLTHGPSGMEITTDAPKDNLGKGEAFSPTDLVAAALASCMLTTMGIVAQRRNIKLDSITAQVMKEMTSAPPRRIAKLPVTITMPKGISAEERALLERAAVSCPVHKSLNPEIEIPVKFDYLD